ncbi:MAG: DNA-deoxyinosine glycosylase [Rubrivivax sp.]
MTASVSASPLLTGFEPAMRVDATLLIMGSFPGEASLAAGQYYAHPRNQFWPIVAAVLGWPKLNSMAYGQRVQAAQAAGLAVWDVYAGCEREGSLDSAIRAAEPNDLAALVAQLPSLRGIAHNGGESARAMRLTAQLGLPVWRLPSTSPANASWSLERKRQAWQAVFEACGLVRGDGGPADPENRGCENHPSAPRHAV